MNIFMELTNSVLKNLQCGYIYMLYLKLYVYKINQHSSSPILCGKYL